MQSSVAIKGEFTMRNFMRLILCAFSFGLVLVAANANAGPTAFCQKSSAGPVGAPKPTLRCALIWNESDEDPYILGILESTFTGPGPNGTTAHGSDVWAFPTPDMPVNSANHWWLWTVAGIHTGTAKGNLYYPFLNTEGVPVWEFIEYGPDVTHTATVPLP